MTDTPQFQPLTVDIKTAMEYQDLPEVVMRHQVDFLKLLNTACGNWHNRLGYQYHNHGQWYIVVEIDRGLVGAMRKTEKIEWHGTTLAGFIRQITALANQRPKGT